MCSRTSSGIYSVTGGSSVSSLVISSNLGNGICISGSSDNVLLISALYKKFSCMQCDEQFTMRSETLKKVRKRKSEVQKLHANCGCLRSKGQQFELCNVVE